MKRYLCILLVVSLCTGLTATASLGALYGVASTLAEYASSLNNLWSLNEFRSNVWNERGNDTDPYSLGIYYSGIDGEYKPVYDFYLRRFSLETINGLSDVVVTKVNPYVVNLSYYGYDTQCVQYEITGKVFNANMVRYVICIPDQTDAPESILNIMFVMSATSGNSYAVVERDNDFMGELRLWLQAPHGDSAVYVKGNYTENGLPVTLAQYLEQYDH